MTIISIMHSHSVETKMVLRLMMQRYMCRILYFIKLNGFLWALGYYNKVGILEASAVALCHKVF